MKTIAEIRAARLQAALDESCCGTCHKLSKEKGKKVCCGESVDMEEGKQRALSQSAIRGALGKLASGVSKVYPNGSFYVTHPTLGRSRYDYDSSDEWEDAKDSAIAAIQAALDKKLGSDRVEVDYATKNTLKVSPMTEGEAVAPSPFVQRCVAALQKNAQSGVQVEDRKSAPEGGRQQKSVSLGDRIVAAVLGA